MTPETKIHDWYIKKLCQIDDAQIVREIPQPKHNPTHFKVEKKVGWVNFFRSSIFAVLP